MHFRPERAWICHTEQQQNKVEGGLRTAGSDKQPAAAEQRVWPKKRLQFASRPRLYSVRRLRLQNTGTLRKREYWRTLCALLLFIRLRQANVVDADPLGIYNLCIKDTWSIRYLVGCNELAETLCYHW